MKKLAILIPTLPARKPMLDVLLAKLDLQQGIEHCNVILDCAYPPTTTGKKRNGLLQLAAAQNCQYIAFIDDDDSVADDYVLRILEATESRPDVVGIEGVITRNGRFPQKFIHSMKYDHWYEEGAFPNKVYYRNPNHLNPVRTELALYAGFPDKTEGEDHEYSKRLFPLLKTEVFLEGPLYFYLATS